MIQAVVFDWGGVFQRTEDDGPRRALERELGLSPGGVERAVFDSVVWERASMGQCDADSAWEAIVTRLGWPAARVDEFVERFFAGDRVDETLVHLVRHLRQASLRVGLLSNAPPPRRGASRAGRWGMVGLFDAQIFSYEVGALKPEARTYHAVLAALGVSAAEVLFVDDALANVAGARAVGMEAVRFTDSESLRRELARRGLATP